MPNFPNILFIEGIPGSGKTFAVLNTIFQVLQQNMPEEFANKKFWLAQTTRENARRIANKFDISDELKNRIETFDHDSLLKYIFTDWDTRSGRNELSYEYRIVFHVQNKNYQRDYLESPDLYQSHLWHLFQKI